MKLTIIALSLCLLVAVTNAFSHSRSQGQEDATKSPTDVDFVTPKKISFGGIGALEARSSGTTVEVVGRTFCALYNYANDSGNGPSKIKSFINKKFPKKWHNYLIGKLVYRGVLAVVDIAAELCGVEDHHADRYLTNALLTEPSFTLPADDCLFE